MLPVFLINLDRSPDRLRRMEAEFQRSGLVFRRFPAVDGTKLPERVKRYFCDAADNIISALYPDRIGQIGCYASHMCVWQWLAAGELGPSILICEDDLALPCDLSALIDEVASSTSQGWDIIRLSSPTKRKTARLAQLRGGRFLVHCERVPPGTGAYLISRTGAAKLLKPRICHRAVDEDLARPWLFDLKQYAVVPPPVVQNIGQSLIEATDGAYATLFKRGRTMSFRLQRVYERFRRHGFNLRRLGLHRWLRMMLSRNGPQQKAP